MRLPLQTFIEIIEHSDLSTKKILAFINRRIRVYAQCILFRHIRMRSVGDLEAFARYASSARHYSKHLNVLRIVATFTDLHILNSPLLVPNQRKLNSIRSFTFDLSVYCGWPNGQAYSYVFQLCSIPATDDKGLSMFRNLKVAYLNVDSDCVGHKLCRNEQFDDSWRTPLSPSFLAGVETIYLKDVSFKLYDELSSVFRVLGMKKVETVHINFKNTLHIPTSLANQLRTLESVRHIILNLEEHLLDTSPRATGLAYWDYCARLSEALLAFARRKHQYTNLESMKLIVPQRYIGFIESRLQSHFTEGNIAQADKDWVLNRIKWQSTALVA